MDDGSTDAHRRRRRAERAPGSSRSPTCCPSSPRDRARATRCGSRCTSAEGDIVCWVDADIRNFRAALRDQACSRRCSTQPGDRDGQGLLPPPAVRRARPAVGASPSSWPGRCSPTLFPHLTRFVQPLAGEYAARRRVLEAVPFVEGWGVEIGLLIDVVERFGVHVDRAGRPGRARAPQPPARPSSARRRWRSSSPRSAAPASTARPAVRGRARALRRRPRARADPGRGARAPADDHASPTYCAKFGRELTA